MWHSNAETIFAQYRIKSAVITAIVVASPIQRLPCAPTFLQTQYSGYPVPPHFCKPNTAVALCPHISTSPIQRLPRAPIFLQAQYSDCSVPPHFCKPNTSVALYPIFLQAQYSSCPVPHISASTIQRLPCDPTFLQAQYSGCPVPHISGIFAQIFLQNFEHLTIKHWLETGTARYYARYVDDMLLFCDKRKTSQERPPTDTSPVHNSMVFKLTGELESSTNILDLKIARDSHQINIGTFMQPASTCSAVRHVTSRLQTAYGT